jgi:hypothetical protein
MSKIMILIQTRKNSPSQKKLRWCSKWNSKGRRRRRRWSRK